MVRKWSFAGTGAANVAITRKAKSEPARRDHWNMHNLLESSPHTTRLRTWNVDCHYACLRLALDAVINDRPTDTDDRQAPGGTADAPPRQGWFGRRKGI